MSRPIEFRVWMEKERRMMPWSEVWTVVCKMHPSMVGGQEGIEFPILLVALLARGNGGLVAEQWTGLNDRLGRPIYEGDLVSFTQRWCAHGPEPEDWIAQEVYYDAQSAAFLFGRQHEIGILDNVDVKTLEIVGNIHSTS